MAFRIRVSGAIACFARPEFRVDRVSYDVITPFAVRAILDAIYWRPQIRWRVDAIQVLNPILFAEEQARAEQSDAAERKTVALVDVDYVIDAHFDLTEPENPDSNAASHTKMFLKRMRTGRYFREPFLGLPEYPATVELIEGDDAAPLPISRATQDLGWIAHDIEASAPSGLRFFRATMEGGVIRVPPAGSPALGA